MTPALELRHVTKCYGSFKAVDDVSFSLAPGSVCGFLGPNGAGKTTTLRMILEIIRPTSGGITVLGQPSALKVRRRLGYLPEEKGLYKKMKTWAVIAYFASLKGLPRKAAKQRAFELLERYGLHEFAEQPTDALSKGMGQKVQVLASVAHDPEFVILDEPFSGLDPVNQQVMEEIIRDLVRRNRTVLFSTHVMSHAERLCERIVLLARGRKVFDGTIAEAKRLLPRRVRIETADNIEPLLKLSEVAAVSRLDPDGKLLQERPAYSTGRSEVPLSSIGVAQAERGSTPSSATIPVPPKELGRSGNPSTIDRALLTEFDPRTVPGISRHGSEVPTTRPVLWELELRESADPQAILEACFDQRIRLHSFNQTEPALHEVFMHLVGPNEVGAR